MKYPLKAVVHCSDGCIGSLTSVIVDTKKKKVTDIAVRDMALREKKYLVPSRWIKETTPELILLNATRAEVRELDMAEANDFTQVKVSGYTSDPRITELWPHLVKKRKVFTVKRQPMDAGETSINLQSKVRAIDGRIGEVSEFIVDHSTWQITHLVIKKGLPWDQKQVSIPITAIENIEDEQIFLNLTKKEVKELPEIAGKI
ncbi:MAG: PRC-barrel domain-containing protein [Deltaproteobacteria bacterium]|nr:PRC-barrel domain-containing protein [Deltaproteobacteria bacterium]